MNEQDQNDLNQIEMSLEHAKKIVEFGKNIATLEKNRAFMSVVFDGYFKEEASRLTMLLATNIPVDKTEVYNALMGIAQFRKFLMDRRSIGRTAEKEVADFEAASDEIRAGEGE